MKVERRKKSVARAVQQISSEGSKTESGNSDGWKMGSMARKTAVIYFKK